MNRSTIVSCGAALIGLVLLGVPASVFAQPTLVDGLGGARGYGTACLSPNDDGSSNEIDLTSAFPGGLEFFGRRHSTAYVNTNGNITFNGPLATFTPDAFPVADQPMIAPYWADVDIRGAACSGFGGGLGCGSPTTNGVWWHLEPGRMVVTWDHVGYFSCSDDLQMTFQLIMTEARYCGLPGDFDVEFRYTQCGWETGNASGGTDGFGGTPAQIGFDAGNLSDFVALMGSRVAGISRVACDMSNVGEPGVWRFRIRRGVVECPDAGDACTVPDAVGVCAVGRSQCRGAGVVCQPLVEPTPEGCDAFDNDCDGNVDEGMGLCSALQICDRGRCIDPCFEGGCPTGLTCSTAGVCIDDACADVTCPSGERCIGGTCTGVCGGVVCPPGQDCVGGACRDLCASVTCSGCEVCASGTCGTRCEVTGCASGEACDENGRCVEEACLGVICGPGRVCREGVCANACDGVVCPAGEFCARGVCARPPAAPDAGMSMPDGGASMSDGGGLDGGTLDVPDAYVRPMPPPPSRDCGCRVPGARRGESAGPLALLGLLGVVVLARRRRLSPVVVGACLALVALGAGCTERAPMPPVGPTCGDGLVEGGEACDDGNDAASDGCTILCLVEPEWECMGSPSVCMRRMVGPTCGDRMVGAGEACDDGAATAECDADCSLVACGDGTVNAAADEECDDGNAVDGDGCTARCFAEPESCGDRMCGAGETCNNCPGDCAMTALCMACADLDMDGARDSACGGTDCNDEDPMVRPGMTEIPCNRVDEDCDRTTRDAADADMDGSSCNFDCDDTDAARAPLFRELCGDMIDNDCDPATPDLFDSDADGARCDMDCDDYRATSCPTCPELCGNTLDDDCNPATLDLFDGDMDGSSCEADCDDADRARRPGGTELCDGIDNDCDMALDGPGEDDDRDGFADATCGCAAGRCTDCDDTNRRVSPAAIELCGNTVDDDCNAATLDAIVDADMDTFACNVDCDDGDRSVFPDAAGRCGPSFNYFEDFETGTGGWTASGTASSWARGVPASTFIPRAASGTNAWVTGLTAGYNSSEDSYLTSPRLDLSMALTDVILSFSHIFQTESCCDEGWLELSTDGGTTWRKVGASGEGTNWYNDSFDQVWNGNSGSAGAWRVASIPLPGTAGQADVRLRFAFSSDSSVEYDGFGIDDVRLYNQLVDAEVTAVAASSSAVCGGGATPLRATVRNSGTTILAAFDLVYVIDGGMPVTEAITRTMRPGDTYEHTFATVPSLTPGDHTIVATVRRAGGDDVPANDSRSLTRTVIPSIAIDPSAALVENFEGGSGGWTGTGSWARGMPSATFIPRAGEGTFAWVTNPAGTYTTSETSYLLSPCYDFSAVTTTPTVSFLHIFDTEGCCDEGWVEVSTDGGTTWRKVGAAGEGGNWYNDTTNQWWDGSSGSSGVWRTAFHALDMVAGQRSVRIRFVLSSDGSVNREGFGVDGFTVTP